MLKILIGVVVVSVTVIGIFLFLDPNVGITQTGGAETTQVDDSHTISVTIDGEVYKPSTYTLDEDATMLDLIDAAGGTTSNADDRAYYETALLTKGMTYYIPSKYDVTDICSKEPIEKININSDDADAIASINGVNATIAASVVTYRTENGLFSTIEQLQEVYGIGSATYKKMRNYVILHV